MLVFVHRPFPDPQPYAEIGPIFFCADPCPRHEADETLPDILSTSPEYLIKGYSGADRIVYRIGAVVPREAVTAVADAISSDPGIAYMLSGPRATIAIKCGLIAEGISRRIFLVPLSAVILLPWGRGTIRSDLIRCAITR